MSDGSLVITDAPMTSLGDGFYKYNFSGYKQALDYSIRADGGAGLSDTDRYMYATNEFDVSIGGGLGITGDMIFDLKKMADNILTKKDLDEFLKKLSKKMNKVKEKLEEDEEKSQEISKMSARIDDNINFLMKSNVNNNKMKTEVERTVNSLKTDFKKINDALQTNKKELSNMVNLNEHIVNSIRSIDKKTNLEELKKQLDNSHKETIESASNKAKILNQISDDLKANQNQISNIVNLNKNIIENISMIDKKKDIEELKKQLELNHKELSQKDINRIKLLSDINTSLNSLSSEIQTTSKITSDDLKHISGSLEDDKKRYDELIKIKASFNNLIVKIDSLFKESEKEADEKADNFNVNILKIKKGLSNIGEEIKDINRKSVSKKDINFISVSTDEKMAKLQKKISEMNTSIKNNLINISKKSRKDDILDVQQQMEMLIDKNE